MVILHLEAGGEDWVKDIDEDVNDDRNKDKHGYIPLFHTRN